MMEEIDLRDYHSSYLDAMYSLDRECFSEEFRFDRESMRAFAEEPDSIVRLAMIPGGAIVGFVITHMTQIADGQRAYLVTLDVAAGYRRRGVAKQLLLGAEERAAANGALWMELHVFTGNEGAIGFYEDSGYERVDVKRRFYGKFGLDAFAYRKSLTSL